jgi:hypothetical protein
MRKDGRKGMTKLIIACHNFAKGPKFASLCTFWDVLKKIESRSCASETLQIILKLHV